jgi:exodeoxyribonuclease-3
LRIDHLLLSAQAVDRLETCAIDREPRAAKAPSEHAPVWCVLQENAGNSP